MRDTSTHTRYGRVSKMSSDSLLVEVNTPQSNEDKLNCIKLMKICTTLQKKVIDLEDELKRTKNAQQTKINALERRVNKLAKKHRSRTHKLKILYIVGLTTRDLQGEEVIVELEVVADKEPIVDTARVSVDATTITIDDITLAKVLEALKTLKPKIREIVIKDHVEPRESRTTTISSKKSQDKGERARQEEKANIALIETWEDIQAKVDADYQLAEKLQAKEQQELNEEEKAKLFMELLEKRRKFFATKRTKEKRNRPTTKAQQRKRSKKQKVEYDKEYAELKNCFEIIPNNVDDVTIDATPLSVKSLIIVDYKIYKERKKSYIQNFRSCGNSQMYLAFSKTLKNFNREDLEVLWRLVKARFKKAKEQQELNEEEKAKLFMELLEKRRKFFATKRTKEKRNRPTTKAQQRSLMCTYLKILDGWKPNALKNKSFAEIQELFDKAMKRINTFVDFRNELVEESTKKDKAETT
nr:hypothetical protein [Tanacetum cinerariifolium]